MLNYLQVYHNFKSKFDEKITVLLVGYFMKRNLQLNQRNQILMILSLLYSFPLKMPLRKCQLLVSFWILFFVWGTLFIFLLLPLCCCLGLLTWQSFQLKRHFKLSKIEACLVNLMEKILNVGELQLISYWFCYGYNVILFLVLIPFLLMLGQQIHYWLKFCFLLDYLLI